MKKILLLAAALMLTSSLSFAVGLQGEVIKIGDDKIVIEMFGDGSERVETGQHFSVKPVPKGTPTLDMLKG